MTGTRGFGAGLLAALFAVVIWGAQLPVAKATYATLDPYTMTAVRYLAALALLLAMLAYREGAAAFVPGDRPYLLVAAGLIGMTGSPLLVFVGVFHTLPEHAAIILALQPSMTALATWLLRGKRPAGFTIATIGLAFAGVVLVVTGHGSQTGEAKFVGDLMVLGGACCWVTYTLLLGEFPRFGALRFTTLTCAIGTLCICLVALVANLSGVARLPDAAALIHVAPHMAYLSVLGVTLSMLAWNYGNARIGPLNSILLLNLIPLETYLIRYLQGAQFNLREWIGVGMVLCALVANNVYQRRFQ